MSIKKYIKRGIKYIIKEHNPPIVKVNIFHKTEKEIFNGKVFIITGGGSGIGLSLAKKLVDNNAKVIITGRNEEKLIKAKAELGDFCEYKVFDVQEIEKFDMILNEIFEKYGRIDGLVNNAGVSFHEWDFMKVTEEGYEIQFNINLKGAYFLTQSFIRLILNKKQEKSNVLFISSERGLMCDDLPYGLTKASINSLVQALTYKYYKNGINVNAVCPGVTASDMTNIDKDGDLYCDGISGRFFVPEEVAEVAAFLLSDFAKCISGQVILTNGGNHIKRGY